MNDNNQQYIEGGPILDALKDMLFKGVSKILDGAARYQDEMGVIKQITDVAVGRKDGTGEPDIITFKLSPVKDHSGDYYIEIDTNDFDIDMSGFDKKVIHLDKTSLNDFNDAIDSILDKSGLTRVNSDGKAIDTRAPSTETLTAIDDFNHQTIELTVLRNPVKGKLDEWKYTVSSDKNVQYPFKPKACTEDEFETLFDKFLGDNGLYTDEDASDNNDEEADSGDASESNEEASTLTDEKLEEEMSREAEIDSSGKINVSLKKVISDNETYVDLIAVSASCTARIANEAIKAVVADDDFISQLSDNPMSFEILDDGDSFNVNEISEFDIADTLDKLFSASISTISCLKSATWYFAGLESHPAVQTCNDAIWQIDGIINELGKAMYIQYAEVPSMADAHITKFDFNIAANNADVINIAAKSLENYIESIELYYVNLDHTLQNMLDGIISSMKQKHQGLLTAANE